jgi:hypothetical protein
METILVKQHIGLGDYLICNGLIRILAEKYNIILPVPTNYLTSVEFMYRDISNISCVRLEHVNYNDYKNIKVIGFDWSEHPTKYPEENFEQMFYRHADIPFECKKTHFKVLRDVEREKNLFNSLNLIPKSYSFLHEYNAGDSNSSVKINRNLITNQNIISVGVNVFSQNIFDYITLINEAAEVHVIESSIFCLIDLCQEIINSNLFCHQYAKRDKNLLGKGNWMIPKNCKNWKVF